MWSGLVFITVLAALAVAPPPPIAQGTQTSQSLSHDPDELGLKTNKISSSDGAKESGNVAKGSSDLVGLMSWLNFLNTSQGTINNAVTAKVQIATGSSTTMPSSPTPTVVLPVTTTKATASLDITAPLTTKAQQQPPPTTTTKSTTVSTTTTTPKPTFTSTVSSAVTGKPITTTTSTSTSSSTQNTTTSPKINLVLTPNQQNWDPRNPPQQPGYQGPVQPGYPMGGHPIGGQPVASQWANPMQYTPQYQYPPKFAVQNGPYPMYLPQYVPSAGYPPVDLRSLAPGIGSRVLYTGDVFSNPNNLPVVSKLPNNGCIDNEGRVGTCIHFRSCGATRRNPIGLCLENSSSVCCPPPK